MRIPKTRDGRSLATALMIALAAVLPGCFPEDNNAEFLKSAPPGNPSPFPNESFAERRARTRNMSPLEKKIEARQKAAAEKAAKKKAAAEKKAG
jgi:hypothetical protein